LGYIISSAVAIVVIAAGLAALYVRHELRPPPGPARTVVRRVVSRPRRVASGDLCVCGGTIGDSGRSSRRFGELLGCTGCARLWTVDGRRIIRRRAGAPS
jgi:hypothetical protein